MSFAGGELISLVQECTDDFEKTSTMPLSVYERLTLSFKHNLLSNYKVISLRG